MGFWTTIGLLLALVHAISAQFGPDNRWIRPDGSKQDFSSTFNAGDTITLSWQSLNNSRSDLWLTHWDSTTYQWHFQVASNVDISVAGILDWHIDVPADTIQSDNRFVLRFYPRNTPYTVLQFAQNASPGFYLTGGTTSATSTTGGGGPTTSRSAPTSAQTTTSASSTGGERPTTTTTDPGDPPTSSTPPSNTLTSTSVSISNASPTHSVPSTQTSKPQSSITTVVTTTNAVGSTITATVTTAAPPRSDVAGSSQSASSSSSSPNLSIAAQVGIGVAAGVFIIILFIAGCFFGRRFGVGMTRRRNESGLEAEGFLMRRNGSVAFEKQVSGTAEMGGSKIPARPQTSNTTDNASLVSKRLSSTDNRINDGRTTWVEVKGNHSYAVEKGGAMVRPGIHEIE